MVTREASRASKVYTNKTHTVEVDESVFAQLTEISARESVPMMDILRTALFLMRHPAVAPLLAPAREALQRAFPGSHTTTQVDDSYDLDLGRTRDQLVVTVWTDADPDETADRLDRFYDDWWLDNLNTADRAVRFDVGVE